MRILSMLVTMLLVSSGFAVGQTKQAETEKPEDKLSFFVLWEEYEKSRGEVVTARKNLAKALKSFKAIRKRAEKATYENLCTEIIDDAKNQHEGIMKAQNRIHHCERNESKFLIRVLRELPGAIEKDIADGIFDDTDMKDCIASMVDASRNLSTEPPETVVATVQQIYAAKCLMTSVVHAKLSIRELDYRYVLVDHLEMKKIEGEEIKETPEMVEVRKLYLNHMDDVILVTERLAYGPTTLRVSPK